MGFTVEVPIPIEWFEPTCNTLPLGVVSVVQKACDGPVGATGGGVRAKTTAIVLREFGRGGTGCTARHA